jgi:ADP-heptose:LPS heptosyltransferase
MKALVLYPPFLGEAIFLSPVIRALKIHFDQAEIHARVPREILFAFEEHPYIDKVISSDVGLVNLLRKERYTFVVDCSGNRFAALVCMITGIKRFTYARQKWKIWLFVSLRINKLRNTHLVDRMMRMLKPLGITSDDLRLEYFIPERDRVPRTWLPEEFRPRFVILFISAPYATRRLPTERMIELCDKINKPIVLLGHRTDKAEADQIQRFFQPVEGSEPFEGGLRELNKKTRIFNGVGMFNRNQIASLAKQASNVFTFDSEMVAIASAFKRPIFLIMGNTVSLFGHYPYRTKFTMLENTSIACRPCSAGGFERCPQGHFKCMRDIVFDFYVR